MNLNKNINEKKITIDFSIKMETTELYKSITILDRNNDNTTTSSNTNTKYLNATSINTKLNDIIDDLYNNKIIFNNGIIKNNVKPLVTENINKQIDIIKNINSKRSEIVHSLDIKSDIIDYTEVDFLYKHQSSERWNIIYNNINKILKNMNDKKVNYYLDGPNTDLNYFLERNININEDTNYSLFITNQYVTNIISYADNQMNDNYSKILYKKLKLSDLLPPDQDLLYKNLFITDDKGWGVIFSDIKKNNIKCVAPDVYYYWDDNIKLWKNCNRNIITLLMNVLMESVLETHTKILYDIHEKIQYKYKDFYIVDIYKGIHNNGFYDKTNLRKLKSSIDIMEIIMLKNDINVIDIINNNNKYLYPIANNMVIDTKNKICKSRKKEDYITIVNNIIYDIPVIIDKNI